MNNLIVTGSIAIDRISVFSGRFSEHIIPGGIHSLNVSFTVDDMTVNYGGTGANIAYNLSLIGEKPCLVGSVGTDAKDYLKYLKDNKINTSHIYQSKKLFTAQASIMTDTDDNQITAFYMGAMKEAHKANNPVLKSNNKLAIISPNGICAMLQYSKEYRSSSTEFIADPGQAIPALSKTDLNTLTRGAFALICNDYEWKLIEEKTGWSKSDVLKKVKYLIITYGKKGSKIWHKDAIITNIPPFKAKKVIDPTGCGDAYRAGLMYGIKEGYNIEKSGLIGSWIASKAVEVGGTQNHKFSKTDFNKFLKTL